jgi:hypothetical protein
MLNRSEKDELIARCILQILRHGRVVGRVVDTESVVLGFDFENRYQIKAISPENPQSLAPVHLELRLLYPTHPPSRSRLEAQIFLADVDKTKRKFKLIHFAVHEEAPRALDALRRIMVLDDLSNV